MLLFYVIVSTFKGSNTYVPYYTHIGVFSTNACACKANGNRSKSISFFIMYNVCFCFRISIEGELPFYRGRLQNAPTIYQKATDNQRN